MPLPRIICRKDAILRKPGWRLSLLVLRFPGSTFSPVLKLWLIDSNVLNFTVLLDLIPPHCPGLNVLPFFLIRCNYSERTIPPSSSVPFPRRRVSSIQPPTTFWIYCTPPRVINSCAVSSPLLLSLDCSEGDPFPFLAAFRVPFGVFLRAYGLSFPISFHWLSVYATIFFPPSQQWMAFFFFPWRYPCLLSRNSPFYIVNYPSSDYVVLLIRGSFCHLSVWPPPARIWVFDF